MDPNLRLGQVWTPSHIAEKMVIEMMQAAPGIKKILDPACGPGTFSKAIHQVCINNLTMTCIDIDERMVRLTKEINKSIGIKTDTHFGDYLTQSYLSEQYDAVIMNPPYIRHELIDMQLKKEYYKYMQKQFAVSMDKRSNLFIFFLLKGLIDLKPGGVLCAIVYDAINHTKYGKNALQLISKHAELIKSTHVQTPFNDTLIDAQILIYKKRMSPIVNENNFNEILIPEGCARLGDLLETKRGTGLALRDVFIAKDCDPFFKWSSPLLTKHRNPLSLIAQSDSRAYIFDSIENKKLLNWLNSRIQCSSAQFKKIYHRKICGPILFNYYIRNNPRHLWNIKMDAASDNFYVGFAKDEFPNLAAWLLLNADIYLDAIVSSGRNQGNGLTKLQLYEYKDAIVLDWRKLKKNVVLDLVDIASDLLNRKADASEVRSTINRKLGKISNVKNFKANYPDLHR